MVLRQSQALNAKVLSLVILTVIISTGSMSAFADHPKAEVSITPSSGCETNNECYSPYEVTVDVDGEVTWTNSGTSPTTVTSGTVSSGPDGIFDSDRIAPGDTFSYKFEEAGEYRYFSIIQPWTVGIVTVEGEMEDDDHGGDDHNGDDHDDKDHMKNGDHMSEDLASMGMLSDNTEVYVWTTEPTAGEMMEITVKFDDAEHVNHNIMVTQNGAEVLNDEGAHHHDGMGKHMTAPLASDDPVDITITFTGYGINEPYTGPAGEQVVFTNVVPEFGTIAAMILAVAIVSIIAVTAKSRLSLTPRI